MQRLKFWLFLSAAAVLAGTATRQFFAGNALDGAMSVLGCIGWFVLALRIEFGLRQIAKQPLPNIRETT